MKVPLELSFRDVKKSEAREELIRDKAEKLAEVCDSLVSCRVAVEKPQRHQQTGNPYRVRIQMRLPPGRELVVKREPRDGEMHDSLDQVLRDAFATARQQLREEMRKLRGDVKTHPEQQVTAVVERLFPEEGYGFLRAVSGEEVYFHENSVLHDDFGRMRIGDGVRYVESMGEEGPQASTVEILDKVSPGEAPPPGEAP